jgi:hypothetical protein
MAMKQYTCDVSILGKGTAKGVVVWLNSNSQAETRKAAESQFQGQKIVGVTNVKEKK